MTEYAFPGVGRLHVSGASEYHVGFGEPHHKYTVKATDTASGRTVTSWVTVPPGYDTNQVVAVALDAVEYVLDVDGGTMWGVYASDISDGDETAAFYRVRGVSHYRAHPYTYDSESEKFPTLKAAIAEFSDAARFGFEDAGYHWDLYPNDSDEPSHRLVLGPRGGVSVERH